MSRAETKSNVLSVQKISATLPTGVERGLQAVESTHGYRSTYYGMPSALHYAGDLFLLAVLSAGIKKIQGERTTMSRVIVLALLALALPIAAWANGIDIVNNNGVISLSNAGIISNNSQLIQFNQHIAPPGHAFGHVNFGTGALSSGTLFTGGTFSDAGSFFNVVGSGGFKGVPKGPIFTGAFVGPITWTVISQTGKGCPTAPCTYQFTLSGTISGQLYTGNTVTGTTVQNITVHYGEFLGHGDGHLHLGNTHIVTPEPGTLALLGTGLIGVATVVRRKLVS